MKYKEFILDQFQIDAIEAIEKNHSVVVSAATGTGKTLIADYIIDKAISEGKKVIYTAPIKALSNQKYRDFKKSYGEEHAGLLTGDVAINPNGTVLVMTTEIYRNMLLDQTTRLEDVSYVVFDEIHYINDIERGTVWEESLIFSPENIRFLCLSATIPNYTQFANWISHIKGHTVDTVNYMKRAVPLEHKFFDYRLGITTIEQVQNDMSKDRYENLDSFHGRKKKKGKKERNKLYREKVPYHIDLVDELASSHLLPSIFFSFSRALCEKRAVELSKKRDYTTPEEKTTVIDMYHQYTTPQIRAMESAQLVRQCLLKGVGIHHAGLLPKLKEVVELLFDKGILRVLYATETFAVGINMPAKSVCFSALEKYDGITFRLLNSKEYFQLAGRAGRRGLDKVGYSISMIDRNHPEHFSKIRRLTAKDTDPIVSRYALSYNTVLNLIKQHDEDTIQTILKSNFGYFVRKQTAAQVRITQSFTNYVRILTRLEFLTPERTLTWKGEFATHIYTKELEIGELVFLGVLDDMTLEQMCITLAALIYEPRRNDDFYIDKAKINPILKKISVSTFTERKIKKIAIKRMYHIVTAWLSGESFEDTLQLCNLAEGDVIRMFRQLIDILRQIRAGLMRVDSKNQLIDKIEYAIDKIDRDIVKVEL